MAKFPVYSNFGQLPRDSGGDVIPSATKFVTQDATGSPQISPLAYSSSVITLVVPDDALQLILAPTTDLRVSEDVAMGRYDVVTAGSKEAFAVALMQNVYIKRDAVDGTVRFRFAKV